MKMLDDGKQRTQLTMTHKTTTPALQTIFKSLHRKASSVFWHC